MRLSEYFQIFTRPSQCQSPINFKIKSFYVCLNLKTQIQSQKWFWYNNDPFKNFLSLCGLKKSIPLKKTAVYLHNTVFSYVYAMYKRTSSNLFFEWCWCSLNKKVQVCISYNEAQWDMKILEPNRTAINRY